MLIKGLYNKPISNTFIEKTTSIAQRIKPLVIIDWLDSRHVEKSGNTEVASSNYAFADVSDQSIIDEAYGLLSFNTTSMGPPITRAARSLSDKEILFNKSRRSSFYFTPNESINGIERESFTWAVAGAKDVNGNVITSNGNWHCLPSDKDDNLEFGYWSSVKSTEYLHATRNGYEFTTPVTLTYLFTARAVNLVKIITSEHYGQIKSYNLKAYRDTTTLVFDQDGEIAEDNYFYNHFLEGITNSDINKILLTIYTTKNKLDYARVHEVAPIYQVDMSDYLINANVSKVRDIHETSLPIAGGGASTAQVSFDNTQKDFNLFNSASTFGKYMKKDLRTYIYAGWQIKKSNSPEVSTTLVSSINTTANSLSVGGTIDFPDGGGSNDFVVIVDKDTVSREYMLCSKSGSETLSITERGYGGTTARSHSAGASVTFDTYEYVPYGVFYVDEWQASSSSMVVDATMSDWQKYSNEKTVTKGFMMQNAIIAESVKQLLMKVNFPKSQIKYLSQPSESFTRNGAILHLAFDENVVDRENATRTISSSLRARFVEIVSKSFEEYSLKDVMLDANDKDLSVLELALDIKDYFTPSLTTTSSLISTQDQGSSVALNFTTGSFTKPDGSSVVESYNGVFDGYYVPTSSGLQRLLILINRGGVKVYLDKILIINNWYIVESGTNSTVTIQSAEYNLTAGRAYELRIEFFTDARQTNTPFQIKLKKNDGSLDWVYSNQTYTMVALDKVGSKANQSYLTFNSGTGQWTVASAQNSIDRAGRRNNAIYRGTPVLAQESGVVSDTDSKSILLASNSYLRIPYDVSYNRFYTSQSDFSISTYIKFSANSFSGNGEFISNWNNSSPNSGFELFYNSSASGLKIVTTTGIQTVSSNTAISNSSFTLMTFTLKGTSLKYYIDGTLVNTVTISGTPVSYADKDLTIGGRGSSYASGAEVAPASFRSMYIDQFAIFNKALSADDVLTSYIETKIQPIQKFPFAYGNDKTVKNIIDDISLADLGRLYIDENQNARYEHYYRFFEPTIDQHANVQQTFSDSTSILDASYNVQLHVNKITVKLKGQVSNLVGKQSLWRADSPTSLATTLLTSNITSTSNSIQVTTTDKPKYPKSGFLKIDNEIVKYSNTTSNAFLAVERAQFDTVAAAHTSNAKVRETLKFDVRFDKTPAFRVENPYISNVVDVIPALIEIIKYEPTHYGAKLIIAASNSTSAGDLVYVEGENLKDNSKSFASIAGVPVILQETKGEIQEKTATLSDNIRKYGLKEMIIENEFITSLEQAQSIADFIISKMSEPVPIVELSILPNPRLQLGDRVKISSMQSFDIINGEYWVISTECQFTQSPSQKVVLRKVV